MMRLSSSTPQEILAERARRLSKSVSLLHEAVSTVELLCFRIAGGRYALDTRFTFSVIQHAQPAILPGTPDYFVGILGVQGDVVPLVDLARFWGGSAAPADQPPVIVLGGDVPEFAIVIDGFDDMIARAQAEIEPQGADAERQFVARVLNDGIALLDASLLLGDPRFSIQVASKERGT